MNERKYEVTINENSIIDIKEILPKNYWVSCWYPQEEGEYIISVCDDSGDYEYWYTQVATYIPAYGIWIKDNDIIPSLWVRYWMELPKVYKGKDEK